LNTTTDPLILKQMYDTLMPECNKILTNTDKEDLSNMENIYPLFQNIIKDNIGKIKTNDPACSEVIDNLHKLANNESMDTGFGEIINDCLTKLTSN